MFFPSKIWLSFFLYHKNPTGNHLIRKSPGFQPILYKFIVWAFLGLNLYLCYARKPNYDLTICVVCGKSSVLESLTLNVPRRCSQISTIGGWDHFGRCACYAKDCSIRNNIGGFQYLIPTSYLCQRPGSYGPGGRDC